MSARSAWLGPATCAQSAARPPVSRSVVRAAGGGSWRSRRITGRNAPLVRIIATHCRCGATVAEDHVADAVSIMVYGIPRVPELRIPATTTLAYLCGVARNEWRWGQWRRAREADAGRGQPYRGLRASAAENGRLELGGELTDYEAESGFSRQIV